jgi:hypothetical protein
MYTYVTTVLIMFWQDLYPYGYSLQPVQDPWNVKWMNEKALGH